jgi:Zn-dependent protease with chaperone function
VAVTVDYPRQRALPQEGTSRTFLTLVSIGGVFLIGATLASLWGAPTLAYQVLHLCRAGWDELGSHMPAILALIVPTALIAGLIRGTVNLSLQLWRTRRHLRRLSPLVSPMPRRLKRLSKELGIDGQTVFVASDRPFAFCGGYWQPRVWVSAGLLVHLDEEELAAVLRHEAHHLRQRDPLRLLVVHTLRKALFFLPVVRYLSGCYEVEQEISADWAAGEMLPLASALHKLLVLGVDQTRGDWVALSGLNVTEARIQQLIQSGSSRRRTWCLPSVLVSLAFVLIVLGIGMVLVPSGQLPPHLDLGSGACDTASWTLIPATFIH